MKPTSLTTFWETGKKILAIGRNYANHAKELGNQVPTSPVFFLKPTTSYLREPGAIEIPKGCEIHHEVELGVVIGQKGRDIPKDKAFNYVGGYALALDLTARNLQSIAKDKGLPWSQSKGYDTFCPISSFIPKEKIPDPSNVELWLKVNGELKQKGNTNQMIFSIPTLIEYLSSVMTLEPGDLILTGTPEGVGPILPGQIVEAGLTNIIEMKFPVKEREVSNN